MHLPRTWLKTPALLGLWFVLMPMRSRSKLLRRIGIVLIVLGLITTACAITFNVLLIGGLLNSFPSGGSLQWGNIVLWATLITFVGAAPLFLGILFVSGKSGSD